MFKRLAAVLARFDALRGSMKRLFQVRRVHQRLDQLPRCAAHRGKLKPPRLAEILLPLRARHDVAERTVGDDGDTPLGLGETGNDLSGEIFRISNGLDLPTVQFTGAGPSIQSTVGGHTPIAFTALPPALSAVQAGQLRALGIAASERSSGMPDVPTFAEQGIRDQEADTITGVVAPAGTRKEIVDLLYREIAKAVGQPDVKERLTALGFKPVANRPDEFGARIRLEIEKWGKVVRDAKLRIE